MRSRRLSLLRGLFVVSRLVLALIGAGRIDYPAEGWFQADVDLVYQGAAEKIVDAGQRPYADFDFEYPPAVLPMVVAPDAVMPWDDYRVEFVALGVALDALGLLGLLRLDRRSPPVAAWVWVGLVPLLGPITYLRLDLIPAVATIWALERIAIAAHGRSGAWLGFGILAKVYPAFLVPVFWRLAKRPSRVLGGIAVMSAAVLGAVFVVYQVSPGAVFTDLWGFHSERGVHIESLWGSAALVSGADSSFGFSNGAYHFDEGIFGTIKWVATVLSVGVVILGVLASRLPVSGQRQEIVGRVADVSVAVVAMLLAVGTVFSPQFLIWVVALAAAAAARPGSAVAHPMLLLIPIAILTQIVFPVYYVRMLEGDLVIRSVLLARNALVLVMGIWAMSAVVARIGVRQLVAFGGQAGRFGGGSTTDRVYTIVGILLVAAGIVAIVWGLTGS